MKNIIITGTSSGIGLELVKIYSKEGFNVISLSRSDLPDLPLNSLTEENNAKFGKVMGFCRACIVGKMEGPDVIEMMVFIGVEETAHRLKKFLS